MYALLKKFTLIILSEIPFIGNAQQVAILEQIICTPVKTEELSDKAEEYCLCTKC